MAPETLNSKKGYSGKSADLWSLGITFYVFFYLRLPFHNSSLLGIVKEILKKKY